MWNIHLFGTWFKAGAISFLWGAFFLIGVLYLFEREIGEGEKVWAWEEAEGEGKLQTDFPLSAARSQDPEIMSQLKPRVRRLTTDPATFPCCGYSYNQASHRYFESPMSTVWFSISGQAIVFSRMNFLVWVLNKELFCTNTWHCWAQEEINDAHVLTLAKGLRTRWIWVFQIRETHMGQVRGE